MKPSYVKAMTAAAFAASLISASVLPAFAADNQPAQEESYIQTLTDDMAPEDEIEPEARDFRELKEVSKYRLEPGKYYMAAYFYEGHQRGGDCGWRSFKIKVLKSYEKERWIGTVRTAQVVDCQTGDIYEINCDDFSFYALN